MLCVDRLQSAGKIWKYGYSMRTSEGLIVAATLLYHRNVVQMDEWIRTPNGLMLQSPRLSKRTCAQK